MPAHALIQLLLLVPPTLGVMNSLDLTSPTWPDQREIMNSLKKDGVLVFEGLGDLYTEALTKLRESDPKCMEEGLQVLLEDGTERLTVARDTINSNDAFPVCVSEEVETISTAFDQVDMAMSKILRIEFGKKLDVFDAGSPDLKKFETLDSKTHLHQYRKYVPTTPDKMTLPFHTDNGLYLLLTPSDSMPLLTMGRKGIITSPNQGDGTVLVLLGTGLTSWLLPESGLLAPPHAVPALRANTTRTVMARMVVAPALSTPQHSPSSLFQDHFSQPHHTETGPTLARLRKQRSAEESQDWPHASFDAPPPDAGIDYYFEGCLNGEGLKCGGGNKPCWHSCDCLKEC